MYGNFLRGLCRRQLPLCDSERDVRLETRSLAIAIFQAVGTAVRGILAPWIFGPLIDTGRAAMLAGSYVAAAALMLAAAGTEALLGVDAEVTLSKASPTHCRVDPAWHVSDVQYWHPKSKMPPHRNIFAGTMSLDAEFANLNAASTAASLRRLLSARSS
jgi:hypothetical protein